MADENEVIRVPYSPEFIESQQDNKKLDAFVKRVNDKFLKITRIDLFAKSPLERGQISIDPSKQTKVYQKFIEKRNLDIIKANTKISSDARIKKAGEKLQKLLYGNATPEEKRKMDRDRISSELELQKQKFIDLSESGASTTATSKKILELQKELQKLDKGKKIGAIQKLFNTFKRVGFYRIARRVFQVIEQGLGRGLEQLIKFDSQTNKTMSSLNSSFDKISASFALLFSPIIDVIEPLISSISNLIVGFANDVALASAKMKGLSEYTKINEEYMKDLQASTNKALLSFDKFETINGEDSPYENAIVNDEEADKVMEKYKGFFDFLNSIKSLLSEIWEFIKLVLDFVANDLVGVSNLLGLIGEGLNQIKSVIGIITSLLKGDFSGAWEHLKDLAGSCLLFMIKALNAVWDSILRSVQLTLDIFVNPFVKLFGGEQIKIPRDDIMIPTGWIAETFADGGIPRKGSLFVAGEAGAEMLTTMPSGQTGVTNIAQFKQAFVEAIYECSDVFQSDDGDVVLKLDGAEIARSKRFKSELNRTNAGLHLI